MCSQVDVYVWDWSLVQRNPTECGVSSECDREAPLSEGRDMQSRQTETVTKKLQQVNRSSCKSAQLQKNYSR